MGLHCKTVYAGNQYCKRLYIIDQEEQFTNILEYEPCCAAVMDQCSKLCIGDNSKNKVMVYNIEGNRRLNPQLIKCIQVSKDVCSMSLANENKLLVGQSGGYLSVVDMRVLAQT